MLVTDFFVFKIIKIIYKLISPLKMSYDFSQPYFETSEFKIYAGRIELLGLDDELNLQRFIGETGLYRHFEMEGIPKEDLTLEKVRIMLRDDGSKLWTRYSIQPQEWNNETFEEIAMITLADAYHDQLVNKIKILKSSAGWINCPPLGFMAAPIHVAPYINIENPDTRSGSANIYNNLAYDMTVALHGNPRLSIFEDFFDQLEDDL